MFAEDSVDRAVSELRVRTTIRLSSKADALINSMEFAAQKNEEVKEYINNYSQVMKEMENIDAGKGVISAYQDKFKNFPWEKYGHKIQEIWLKWTQRKNQNFWEEN